MDGCAQPWRHARGGRHATADVVGIRRATRAPGAGFPSRAWVHPCHTRSRTVMKTALITGVSGQDGAYLVQLLLDKGYKVYGAYRRTSSVNFWRMQELGVSTHPNLELVE